MEFSALIGSAVAEDRQRTQRRTAAALQLLARLPPKDLEQDLDALSAVAPELEPGTET